MSGDEGELRAALVREALSWIGTPFHDGANLKGVGVDCQNFLIEVYRNAGVISDLPEFPYFGKQWFFHTSEELYLNYLLRFGFEIPGPPRPGDVVMYKMGKAFSHSAVVIEWPKVVHVLWTRVVTLADAEREGQLLVPRKFLSFWEPGRRSE